MKFVRLFCPVLLFFSGTFGQVQVDTTLAQMLLSDSSKYVRVYLRVPLAWDSIASNPGNVIKHDQVLYFLPDQYGAVFSMEREGAGIRVRRIDRTRFAGINGGHYCFFSEQLYSFGGYGFWQTNGQLRSYVKERAEWEIVKLNEVVPSRNFFTYFDPAQSMLWCAEQDYENEVLETGKFQRNNYVYRLSPKERIWEKVGSLNFTRTNTDLHEGIYLETPYGVLVNSGGPKFEIWNFEHNKRYDLGPLSDSIRSHFLPTWQQGNHSMLFIGQKILIYDHKDRMVFKSFPLSGDQLRLMAEEVYSPVGSMSMLVWLLPAILIPISVLAYRKWGRGGRVKSDADMTLSGNLAGQTTVLNGTGRKEHAPLAGAPGTGIHAFLSQLTNLEKEILDRIAADTRKGLRTSQESLNHLLGTERRGSDVQKRHRSDILKSINQKYARAMHSRELLIQRNRSEEDQRLFDYFINEGILNSLTN